jgi:hypothetical protein
MVEMTGGCLRGQVRYSANADPAFAGVCHCTHCQKQTGTAFSVPVGIPKSASQSCPLSGEYCSTRLVGMLRIITRSAERECAAGQIVRLPAHRHRSNQARKAGEASRQQEENEGALPQQCAGARGRYGGHGLIGG